MVSLSRPENYLWLKCGARGMCEIVHADKEYVIAGRLPHRRASIRVQGSILPIREWSSQVYEHSIDKMIGQRRRWLVTT